MVLGNRRRAPPASAGPGSFFMAGTTVDIEPTAEELIEIAIGAADVARQFQVEPGRLPVA